jgi:hypothetical protein
MVLWVDEKRGVQALDRTAPILPLLPGTPQWQTHDYTRYGVTNLYAALEVASGKVISQLTPRHRAVEFKRFLAHVDHAVPARLELHVICDNSSHKTRRSSGGWSRTRACTCISPDLQLLA